MKNGIEFIDYAGQISTSNRDIIEKAIYSCLSNIAGDYCKYIRSIVVTDDLPKFCSETYNDIQEYISPKTQARVQKINSKLFDIVINYCLISFVANRLTLDIDELSQHNIYHEIYHVINNIEYLTLVDKLPEDESGCCNMSLTKLFFNEFVTEYRTVQIINLRYEEWRIKEMFNEFSKKFIELVERCKNTTIKIRMTLREQESFYSLCSDIALLSKSVVYDFALISATELYNCLLTNQKEELRLIEKLDIDADFSMLLKETEVGINQSLNDFTTLLVNLPSSIGNVYDHLKNSIKMDNS